MTIKYELLSTCLCLLVLRLFLPPPDTLSGLVGELVFGIFGFVCGWWTATKGMIARAE